MKAPSNDFKSDRSDTLSKRGFSYNEDREEFWQSSGSRDGVHHKHSRARAQHNQSGWREAVYDCED